MRREVALQCPPRERGISREGLVAFCLDAMGELDLEGEVGVRLVGGRTMASLNSQFRGKAGPTDVLSFKGGCDEADAQPYLGDLAVCLPVAAAAALKGGWPLERELRLLLLHGLLHLAGFDHEADEGEMARKERSLRRKLGLGPGTFRRAPGGRG